MNAFELARPKSAAEAVQLLTGEGRQHMALAGGQDILALMKDEVLQPVRLVNLKSLPGLNRIEVDRQGRLNLGALVTLAQLEAAEPVRKAWSALAEAAAEAGTPQIRNLGTVGGNLCQKPRCWYYRAAPLHCARKGGDACLATTGDNRYHSIFAFGGCVAPSYSALATPLTAYQAAVEVQGPGGTRQVKLADLYRSLEQDPTADTVLKPNEIITRVVVPPARGLRVAHREVRQMASHDWPLAMATVALDTNGGTVRQARVVLGAVAPIPWISAPAAAALKGKPVTGETARQAAEAALKEATPLSENGYKVRLTANLLRRTILAAAGVGEG
ncbi:MAG: FAD binding domain-containing protein [Armatimonadetes bacterium]|nr:FAD binding domain-containing protein [Armatimonadota bacterium]